MNTSAIAIRLTYAKVNFVSVLFILIMSGALWQELTQKYMLQDQLAEGEKKWSSLMDNIGLIVTELKPDVVLMVRSCILIHSMKPLQVINRMRSRVETGLNL